MHVHECYLPRRFSLHAQASVLRRLHDSCSRCSRCPAHAVMSCTLRMRRRPSLISPARRRLHPLSRQHTRSGAEGRLARLERYQATAVSIWTGTCVRRPLASQSTSADAQQLSGVNGSTCTCPAAPPRISHARPTCRKPGTHAVQQPTEHGLDDCCTRMLMATLCQQHQKNKQHIGGATRTTPPPLPPPSRMHAARRRLKRGPPPSPLPRVLHTIAQQNAPQARRALTPARMQPPGWWVPRRRSASLTHASAASPSRPACAAQTPPGPAG